jgi:hypothetical protein
MRAFPIIAAWIVSVACVGAAAAAPLRVIDASEYEQRLQAFWLASAIANWTGRITEGQRKSPPFYTDADWLTVDPNNGRLLDFVLDQDPWGADDDTDIEYVYVHLAHTLGRNELTPQEITDGWIAHINRFIWVSNEAARDLMDRGVQPPSTSSTTANGVSLRIDAQLTTEIFGAIAPGMTSTALELGDLPVRTTASSHAAHAAQLFIAMFAEAATAPTSQPIEQQILELYANARLAIPDTSKAADVADYVLTDFLDNPDPTDWERTRDRVHERYQALLPDAYHGFASPASLGFRYRGWTESSVNLAGGLIALLYGGGDLDETIRIGSLTGWDSDNGTATVAGVVALLVGPSSVTDAWPDETFSDRYDIDRTRDALPDYLPGDPDAQDTFSLLAQRMIPLVHRAIIGAGGRHDPIADAWILPPPRRENPLTSLHDRSANNRVRLQGGTVTASSSVVNVPTSNGYGRNQPGRFANGIELDYSGFEPTSNTTRPQYTSQGSAETPGTVQTLTVTYSTPVEAHTIRFVEGEHFPLGTLTAVGGWFQSIDVEVLVGGTWQTPAGSGAGGVTQSEALDPARPYQVIDFVFDVPIQIDGVRLAGPSGGADGFVNAVAIDVLSAPSADPPVPFDLDFSGIPDVDDLYAWHAGPVDLDADGATNEDDRRYLLAYLRWLERTDTLTDR